VFFYAALLVKISMNIYIQLHKIGVPFRHFGNISPFTTFMMEGSYLHSQLVDFLAILAVSYTGSPMQHY
jgi:hypothetical protein